MKARETAAQKITSLAALETLFFRSGGEAAADALANILSPNSTRYYVHLREGEPIVRTDAGKMKTVEYQKLDPPRYYDRAYQVMMVTVNPGREEAFLYHDGEEFIIPISGPGILYDFFWAKEGLGNVPRVYPDTPALVQPGEAIRTQPQIPHRAWGAPETVTRAWMITRPLANTAAQIYLDSNKGEQHSPVSRQATIEDLEKSGPYALRAWGISDAIRRKRMRNNRRIAQVADACQIDAAHLSKIESGTTNVTFDNLKKICKVLDIDLTELIAPPAHPFTIASLDGAVEKGVSRPVFEKPPRPNYFVDPIKTRYEDHYIHPIFWHITDEQLIEEPEGYWWASTWIALAGKAVVDIQFKNETVNSASEVLVAETGSESVLHLRGGAARLTKIHPLEETRLLEIKYSPEKCYCL